jgi:hypothetical protein
MSYWVYLHDDNGAVEVAPCIENGNYNFAGAARGELNVTYHYTSLFTRVFAGKTLHEVLDGHKAEEVIPLLETAIQQLDTKQSSNYWEAAPGNAATLLQVLLSWARQYPEGIFRV